MRLFNAFQMVTLYAALPIIIGKLWEAQWEAEFLRYGMIALSGISFGVLFVMMIIAFIDTFK